MSKMVGIDLGTTNSLVAVVDSGIPYVIADAEGRRLTPSVVHFPGEGAAPWVGRKAARVRVVHPRETVYAVKRFIGRRAEEVSDEEMIVTYPMARNRGQALAIPIRGREYRPEEISALVLEKLKADAEAHLGEPVTRAVITVPAYFNDAQRTATKRAGEQAGLTVERIINEPTAAALAYGLNRLREKSKIAVYDLGGGTFDLTLLEMNQGVFQVLATHGNTRLGGEDLDRRLVTHLAAKIRERGGPDIFGDLSFLARVREAAEEAKIKLSTESEAVVTLPFLTAEFNFGDLLRRDELEELVRDLVMRTREYCWQSLSDANLSPKELDQVILVGGQTRMPLVRRLVAEFFGCRGEAEEEQVTSAAPGPLLNTSQNPEEVVALGAAIQAEILSGGFRDMLLLDVTPLSLGLETFGGLMNVVIPRNTTIPTKAGEVFTTAVDRQRSMLIQVLQGERERAADNWGLGKFTLEFEPAPKGVPRVGVQFEIDANGILHVLARDLKTGHQKVVELKSAVDVDDAAVQEMVEASVEHAFEDLRTRQWVEAKLRAEEILEATRKGLSEFEGGLEPDETQEVIRAKKQLETRLATEPSPMTAEAVAQLKAALQALDEATRPLAQRMMDKAMETILQERGLL